MNGYELSRTWFDWCFLNPEKIKPNHTALYFFCIEHCNRLGWKEKFGLPTTMAKEAIGISSYNTYINTLNDLVEFGFIKMIERSKNQYSSNIIALSKFDKALDKALDKAFIKHCIKQEDSTDSIDKPLTTNKKPKKQIIEELTYPYNSELFLQTWGILRNEKKWYKKSITALQASLNKLSKYPESVAIEMMNNSISGGYQGVFEIKESYNQQNKTVTTQTAPKKNQFKP